MQYFKYKLKPNKAQKDVLNKWIGACRCLYNTALEQRKMIDYKEQKARSFATPEIRSKLDKSDINSWGKYHSINYDYQAAELKALKSEFSWLKDVPAQALQYSLRHLDNAFQRFFKGEGSFPKRKKKTQRAGIKIPKGRTKKNPKGNFQVLEKHIHLPKMKDPIRFIRSRAMEGEVKSLTITKVGESYFVSILCDVGDKYDGLSHESTTHVGIDRGIAKSIAISDGNHFDLPKLKIKKLEEKIAREQVKLARKMKYSNNWYKSKRKIFRFHKKITNIRLDSLWKVAVKLSKNHAVIALEDLKIRNMSRSSKGTIDNPGKMVAQKSGLNRAILREGWYDFAQKLDWQAKKRGVRVIYCDPKYTSLTCNKCAHRAKENRQSQAEFQCVMCHHKEDADTNASRNILDKALGTGVFSLEAS